MSQSGLDYPRRSLAQFTVGEVRERSFRIDEESLLLFIAASGDSHPLHTNTDFARNRGYRDVLVHGMCISARCSAFVAEEFVGSHGLLVSMSADFRLPVFYNESLIWRGEALRVDPVAETVEIKWAVSKDKNIVVQRGTACAWLGGGR
jgi:3-hydroxybutyryl-CoA dehydratase